MHAILYHRYDEAKEAMLKNLAWMHRTNEEWADKRGGKEQLSPEDARKFNASLTRIQAFMSCHDAAEEYIACLEQWCDELMKKNRALAEETRYQDQAWRKFFPRLLHDDTESQREHNRRMTKINLELSMPNLF